MTKMKQVAIPFPNLMDYFKNQVSLNVMAEVFNGIYGEMHFLKVIIKEAIKKH